MPFGRQTGNNWGQNMKKQYKSLTILLSVLTALVVLTGSIAVPLLCRPFYYAHIDSLDLCGYTGLSVEQIRAAYDEMMDFCLGMREDFAVGGLIWSDAGRDHFVDVRGLFLLDLGVLAFCLGALAVLFALCIKKGWRPYAFQGHGPGFWGAVGLGVAFVLVGALAAVDFDRAFVIFHQIFFPGKSNWIFDWRTDPIILLLPQIFFQNCAILILALILVWCAVLIGTDLWAARQREKRRQHKLEQQLPGCAGGCEGCSGCG